MNEKYNVFPKLIECRKLLGYTQKDMAVMVGVGRETYKKHERGEFDFRLTEMLAIKKFINDKLQTNFSLDELFTPQKNRLNALYGSFKPSMINHKGEIVEGGKLSEFAL